MTRTEEYDVGGMDQDELVEFVVEELMECERCQHQHEAVTGDLTTGHTPDGQIAMQCQFVCDRCDWQNDNTALLGP